jgi:P-type E1-E2 ATPase
MPWKLCASLSRCARRPFARARGGTSAVEEVVPGGLVRLAAGDIVPADCRLVGARDLFVNQALLTGEAYPVEKQVGGLAVTVADISGATNYLFMGTSIISGTATAVACRTGRTTVLGELAGSLVAQRPQDAFEHGIRRFGLLMLRFTTFLVLFVLAANVLFQRPWLEADRRAKAIVLTASGRALVNRLERLSEDLERELLTRISQADVATTRRTLEHVCQMLLQLNEKGSQS